MDDRIVQFIAGLRAAGIRVSLAESQDALRAVEALGVMDRAGFQAALRATLVKQQPDRRLFDRLFPLYFGSGGPPLIPSGEALTPEQQQTLQAAMRALAGELNRLMQMLASGQGPTPEQWQRQGQRAGADRARDPEAQNRLARQMMRQMGAEDLKEQIERLLEELERMGMTPEGREAVRQLLEANADQLAEQARQAAGESIARNLTQNPPDRMEEQQLMQRPFNDLSENEARAMRLLVGRLAARLRSRAALRQKKGAGRTLDAKTTLRSSLRTGGAPFVLHFRKRHLKPKFALICDVSTSMRPVAEFMLRLMYSMQDQVSKSRSFAFNDHLEEVSEEFVGHRPDEAIPLVLYRIPPGYYSTDLGHSLDNFCSQFMDAVDRRTTVIFLGDARNNFNNPRLDLFDRLRRQAKRVVWFNPEARGQWGSGDSDMLQYQPLCAAVHQVSNLAELAEAVDKLFA